MQKSFFTVTHPGVDVFSGGFGLSRSKCARNDTEQADSLEFKIDQPVRVNSGRIFQLSEHGRVWYQTEGFSLLFPYSTSKLTFSKSLCGATCWSSRVLKKLAIILMYLDLI